MWCPDGQTIPAEWREKRFFVGHVTILFLCCCSKVTRTKNNVPKKELILAYGSGGIRVHDGRELWKQMAGMAGSWELTTSTTMKQRVNWKWCEARNSQSLPPVTYLLQQGHVTTYTSPNSANSRNWVSKYVSLWEAFLIQTTTGTCTCNAREVETVHVLVMHWEVETGGS